jgi:hypothetical protein
LGHTCWYGYGILIKKAFIPIWSGYGVQDWFFFGWYEAGIWHNISSTLITLFSENLKFSKNFNYLKNRFCLKENIIYKNIMKYLGTYQFSK